MTIYVEHYFLDSNGTTIDIPQYFYKKTINFPQYYPSKNYSNISKATAIQ